MYFIKDYQLYTVTSHTDYFIVAKKESSGYLETFKKDEIEEIYAGVDEIIPDALMNKSVFDVNREDNVDGAERKYKKS